jgi:hypothetical protein
MNYKLLLVPAVSLLAAACDFKGNVYPMTPQQAYDKLVAAPVERSGKGPFGMLEISAGGDGNGTVRWSTSSGTTMCEANITPEGADKSRIMAYCGAGGEGAAAGMTQALHRKAILEHIDATLRGRPYDPKLAYGTTAGLWPDDPRQADGSIGVAATDALKMERDMRKDMSEMQNVADEMEAQREAKRANGDVNFKPGQPMIDPSK